MGGQSSPNSQYIKILSLGSLFNRQAADTGVIEEDIVDVGTPDADTPDVDTR